jgi:uncharacterized protein (TIGR03083 family)
MVTKDDTDRWLQALHSSSARLDELVGELSEGQLSRPSFADEWSVAHVLSHLGSAAEICTMLVQRGIAGDMTGPVREELLAIWERWDTMPASDQREAWKAADARHLALLDSVDPAQRTDIKVPYSAGQLSLPVYAGYRLSEQAVHAWDISVSLDPAATIPTDEVDLLWERIDLVATRFRDGAILSRLSPAQVAVEMTDRRRKAFLYLGPELHIYPAEPADQTGTLTGTSEALLRLVYGRYRPGIDKLETSGGIHLDDLIALFPGF